MLTIRLARVGKNKRAQFQIVLQEHTIAPGGSHVEILGSYDPHSKKAILKEEKIKQWVSQGAKLSDTAYNLFVSKGIISGEKRKVKIPKKEVKEEPVVEIPKAEPSAAKAKEDEGKKEEVKEKAEKKNEPESK
ncbi:MAG: 30S ribosomal protein S16 [Candidatus Moranbacteria bacterium]|nr:30S ribosomal protein S16 [Candidatus Moranbacteria bacterium]